MQAPDPVQTFPRGTTTEIVIVVGFFLFLLGVAVFVDILRRRKQAARNVELQWDAVKRIAEEKELTPEESEILFEILRRWAPSQPHMAATVRDHFNSCVDKEMLRLKNDPEKLESAGVLLRDVRVRLALDYIPVGQRMSNTRDLFTGQTIWMANRSDDKVRWHRFQVTELNEAYFYATHHEEGGESPRFTAGSELRCRMWREDDARYVYVVNFVRIDADPERYVFRHTDQMDRLQSREHFRVRLDTNIVVGVLDAPVDENFDDVHSRRTVTKVRGRLTSLSAGGCALVIPQALPKQVLLRILLDLPNATAIEVEAAIVGATPISGGRHLVRARFIAMRTDVSDALSKYVMRRQQPIDVAQEPVA